MTESEWEKKISKFLVGKTIESIRYMTHDEAQELFGWDRKAIIIWFTDGSHMIPSRDDEGNGPGALFTSDEDLSVIPVY
tara:strand:- start:163 stop:399 length:237 start_codon:yes stop_codon:yes gene_type:complete